MPYRAAMALRVSPRTTTWTNGGAACEGLGVVVAIGEMVAVVAGVGAGVAVVAGVSGGGVDGDGLAAPEPAPACRIQTTIAGLAR